MQQLKRAPVFVAARTESGLFAADSSIINDTNFPPDTISLQPHGEYPTILGHWYAAAGTVAPSDWVDIQVLYRDQKSATAMWLPGPVASGLMQYEQFELPTHACTQLALRIVRVSSAAGEDLTIMAANSPHVL